MNNPISDALVKLNAQPFGYQPPTSKAVKNPTPSKEVHLDKAEMDRLTTPNQIELDHAATRVISHETDMRREEKRYRLSDVLDARDGKSKDDENRKPHETAPEAGNELDAEMRDRLSRAIKAPKEARHEILYGSDPKDVVLLSNALKQALGRKAGK
jgi:hypothetical protein